MNIEIYPKKLKLKSQSLILKDKDWTLADIYKTAMLSLVIIIFKKVQT